MKKLVSEKMLELLDPTPLQRMEAAERFCILSEAVFTPNKLENLTAEGFLTCKQIDYGTAPQYLVWYHKTLDGGLHVNAALQATTEPIFETLSIALDVIARHLGCSYIRWTTRRAGLLMKAEKYGYEAQAIVMTKQL